MELSIIDDPKGVFNKNINLLWASSLLSERINSSCPASSIMLFFIDYDTLNMQQKLSIYLFALQRNPETNPEVITKIEKLYATIAQMEQRKGKTKEGIVALKKAQILLNGYLTDYARSVKFNCDHLKLSALLPFTCDDLENWNKPILLWRFPEGNEVDNIRVRITIISTMVFSADCIPFFDERITNYAPSFDFSNKDVFTENGFQSYFLFEIPEPLDLSTSQVHLIRNQLGKASGLLLSEIENLNIQLKGISFQAENFKYIDSLYQEKIENLRHPLQNSINQNECFNLLKNENGIKKTYKIYAGISSFNTFLSFYKGLGVINESDELYLKEEGTSPLLGSVISPKMVFFIST